MSETTTQTPVSAEALARAQADYAEADARLRDADAWHPQRQGWIDKKISAHGVIRRAVSAAAP